MKMELAMAKLFKIDWMIQKLLDGVASVSQAWRTRELSAYGKVHSCNLPYVKTSRVRATLERFLARMNKTLPNIARKREVFA